MRQSCYDEITSGRSAVWLAHLVWDQGVGGSNPLAPIFFQGKPFGQQVEGLSHFQSESYVADLAVQKRDFDHSSLCRVFQVILSRRIKTK
jgi:hypothetical protein